VKLNIFNNSSISLYYKIVRVDLLYQYEKLFFLTIYLLCNKEKNASFWNLNLRPRMSEN